MTITKAITITSDGGSGEGGILASGTNGITVNAGAADVVKISGLFIHGGTPLAPGLNGIRFIAGGALHVRNTVIVNFASTAVGNGNGILFAPSGASELFVTDTFISESGINGILIQPTGSGSAKAAIIRTNAVNSTAGIRSDGTGSSGGINVSIQDSVVSGNTNAGVTVFNPVGGPAINVMVQGVAAVNNGVPGGLRVDGANATMRVGSSIVSGNGTGTAILNGGVISSYGNNQINGNTADGPNPPTIPLK
ncbi:MAG: hypothetical protein Q7R41_06975 [Phycisphaerales bacterium]|nr:hypothetical protein [Phycisphaerales bacterium]